MLALIAKILGGLALLPVVLFCTIYVLFKFVLPRPVIRKILFKTVLAHRPEKFSTTFEGRVQPHSDLQEVASNLWVIKGKLPPRGPQLPRSMVVYRIPRTKNLVLWNVLVVNEDTLDKIDGLGTVKYLIVPNSWHRLDIAAYAARYPNAIVTCSAEAAAVVSEAAPVAPENHLEKLFPASDSQGLIRTLFVPGLYTSNEPVLEVVLESSTISTDGPRRSPRGASKQASGSNAPRAFLVGDLMFNLLEEDRTWFQKVTGSPAGLCITRIGITIQGEHLAELKKWVSSIAIGRNIQVIVVAHGEPVVGSEDDIAARLVEVAEAVPLA